ncbi:hypothetical protein U1Q18_007015 [Sarracenia purpurea var. burkii]
MKAEPKRRREIENSSLLASGPFDNRPQAQHWSVTSSSTRSGSLGFSLVRISQIPKQQSIVYRVYFHFLPSMDPSSLNSAELQHFIDKEKEMAMINEIVTKLTSVCWDKCISSTPGRKFSSGESSCLSNCAQRYMDMSLIIMKRFQSMNSMH